MIISEENAGRRGSVYRTVGSMFANFNFPKNDGDVSLSSLISASWESVRMLYVATVVSHIVTSTHNVLFSSSRKAVLIALSVFLSLPEARGAQLVLALVWLVLNVSVCRCPSPLHDF
jgi:hypothetical protein